MLKMNQQKLQSNPFKKKSSLIKTKYGIDSNNNSDNKSDKKSTDRIIQRHKFKGVQKDKLKTPAQDRLLKIKKTNPAAVADLLENPTVDFKPAIKNVLPKNYSSCASVVNSGNSLKLTANETKVKFANAVQPAQAIGKTVSGADHTEENKIKWSNENVSKIASTTTSDAPASALASFHLPGNGSQPCQSKSLHSDIIKKVEDVQVQNRLKINDNSKIIGVKKLKLKTPAQDRLQKFANKNKAALVESLHELVDVDVDMIVSDSKSQRKSIGIQKSHVTGREPSIIDIMNKSGTINGCKIDVTAAAATDDADAAAAAAYIIPDTNVFLNSLACIKNVIDRGLNHIIFVPFAVLQELDSQKQRRGEQNFTLKYNAKRAIRYIYELSTSDNKRLQGQSALEDKNHLIDIKRNDDKILNCCLQLVKQSKKVILVTQDLNFTNIAKFSDIETITPKRCLEKIP